MVELAAVADAIEQMTEGRIAAGEMPTWGDLRRKMQQIAEAHGEWAGIPLPVEDLPLILEPRYPWAGLGQIHRSPEEKLPGDDEFEVVNHWYSTHRGVEVWVVRREGRSHAVMFPTYGAVRLQYVIKTLGCCTAWDLGAELAAQGRLGELLKPTQMKQYLLTGTFLESSQRSGVFYLFRRCRPTVAMSSVDGSMHLLTTLCLHPIGHYEGTYAGAMVPTDDVIAHLLLMRADEHKYWAKANHHPAWSPVAGV